MLDLIAPLAIGFFGSLHCLGMCGPLLVAYSVRLNERLHSDHMGASQEGLSRQHMVLHHAAFHFGRLLCYGILGAVAAGLFHAAEVSRLFFHIRVNLHLIVGGGLILFGALIMKILPAPRFLASSYTAVASMLSPRISRLVSSPGMISKAALGFSIGFLPCCLSWAMILTAASTMRFDKGFLTMVAFGTGTLPALCFTGLVASAVSLQVRFMGERIAGGAVVAVGVLLIARGTGIVS